MRYRIPGLILPIALLLVAPPPARAAEVPLESFVDRVDVNIVNVEVFVTDRAGRRVTGLTREDFELFEDGKPVEITNFYAIESTPGEQGAPEAATAEPRAMAEQPQEVPEEQRLSLLVFVDNLNILPNHRTPVLKPLDEFLDQRLVQGDRVMLLTFDGRINVVQTFTQDRQLLAEGVKKMGKTLALRPSQQAAQHFARRWYYMDRHEGVASGGMHLTGRRHEASTLMLSTIAAIEDAIRFLGTQSGRRAILYISDGWNYSGPFKRLPRMANAHLVTIYALDARGPADEKLSVIYDRTESAGNLRTVTAANHDMAVLGALLNMAVPTGGAVFSGNANFAESLRRLGEDFNTFYSLGYASRNTGDVKFHKIKVKIRRKGLKLRHRSGYLEKPLEERVADRFLAAVLLGQAANPLGIQLAVGEPDDSGSKKVELPILVKIPSAAVTFLPRDDLLESRLRIFLAVQDDEHKLALVRQLPYPMTVPLGESDKIATGEIGYQTTLRIRPGSQRVAVGVWDEISGVESFIHETVVVGEPESATGDG